MSTASYVIMVQKIYPVRSSPKGQRSTAIREVEEEKFKCGNVERSALKRI